MFDMKLGKSRAPSGLPSGQSAGTKPAGQLKFSRFKGRQTVIQAARGHPLSVLFEESFWKFLPTGSNEDCSKK